MSPLGTLDGSKQNPDPNTNKAMTMMPTSAQEQSTEGGAGLATPAVDVGAGSRVLGNGSATSNNKHNSADNGSSTLNVNSILADADGAATAAQTITLPQAAMTSPVGATTAVAADPTVVNASNGTKIAINNNTHGTNNADNLNQYVVASTGIPSASTNGVMVAAPAPPTFNNITFSPTPATLAPAVAVAPITSPADPNSAASIANHQQLQTALLQQNAAIMQQNTATLQHLQNLQQTNKLLTANTDALGMLAPIMNMTTTNPVQLLTTTTTTPSLVPNPAATFLPTTLPTTTLPAPVDLNGTPTFSVAPVSVQPQPGIAIPAPSISIAPGVPQPAFAANPGVVDANSSNDAVQNILRTAFMLQSGGLPILQQGIIPQQQQHVIAAPSGGNLAIPTTTISPAPFGIVPATVSTPKSNTTSSDDKKVDANNNGSGAAAAANAAASVLPPASMNLPLQQQLQQPAPQLHTIPQIGIDLNSNNNAIALLGGAANGLQLAGLATLQQQQQSNPAAMVFPQIDPHGQLQLVAQHPKQHLAINPSAQEAQATKNLSSIVRPLYLDHDSNCKSLVYRLSQFLSFH